jgi:hypothetical protein
MTSVGVSQDLLLKSRQTIRVDWGQFEKLVVVKFPVFQCKYRSKSI